MHAISSRPACVNSNPQDLEKSTKICKPQVIKGIGGSKQQPPYISTVCPLQDRRETHMLVLNQLLPQEQVVF